MIFKRDLRLLDRALRNPSALTLDFHGGRRPAFVRKGRKRLRVLGDLRGVVYRTRKGAESPTDYVHGFRRKRPVLAMDARKNLYIVRRGSRYTITSRGIEG